MSRRHDGLTCPVCGSEVGTPILNETAIRSPTAWTVINLTDEQISKLASGMFVIRLAPFDAADAAAETNL